MSAEVSQSTETVPTQDETQTREIPTYNLSPEGGAQLQQVNDNEGGMQKPQGGKKPWADLMIALEGFEFSCPKSWLGKDPEEQQKNAQILYDILRKECEFATMSTRPARKGSNEPEETIVWRFSIYSSQDKAIQAVSNISKAFNEVAWNYDSFPGSVYSIITYQDGTDDLVQATVGRDASMGEAIEQLLEKTFKRISDIPQAPNDVFDTPLIETSDSPDSIMQTGESDVEPIPEAQALDGDEKMQEETDWKVTSLPKMKKGKFWQWKKGGGVSLGEEETHFMCDFCDYETPDYVEFENHIMNVHPDEPIEPTTTLAEEDSMCRNCGFTLDFHTNGECPNYPKMIEKGEEEVPLCPKCGARGEWVDSEDYESGETENIYGCPKCGYSFTTLTKSEATNLAQQMFMSYLQAIRGGLEQLNIRVYKAGYLRPEDERIVWKYLRNLEDVMASPKANYAEIQTAKDLKDICEMLQVAGTEGDEPPQELPKKKVTQTTAPQTTTGETIDCPTCDGTGGVVVGQDERGRDLKETCSKCKGTGQMIKSEEEIEKCSICGWFDKEFPEDPGMVAAHIEEEHPDSSEAYDIAEDRAVDIAVERDQERRHSKSETEPTRTDLVERYADAAEATGGKRGIAEQRGRGWSNDKLYREIERLEKTIDVHTSH